jgi:hypothetical protein
VTNFYTLSEYKESSELSNINNKIVLNHRYISGYMCERLQNPGNFKEEAYVLLLVCCTVYRVASLRPGRLLSCGFIYLEAGRSPRA